MLWRGWHGSRPCRASLRCPLGALLRRLDDHPAVRGSHPHDAGQDERPVRRDDAAGSPRNRGSRRVLKSWAAPEGRCGGLAPRAADLGRQAARRSLVSVEEVMRSRLYLREDILETEWRLWEHKTLNIHRGVLHWRPTDQFSSLTQMSERVREQAESRFRVAWWRGFAFGALIEAETIPRIFPPWRTGSTHGRTGGGHGSGRSASATAEVAVGVHTWTEGLLSPVYRDLLDCYGSLNYEVGSFRKEKDQFMKFLTAAARLKGFRFTEFEA